MACGPATRSTRCGRPQAIGITVPGPIPTQYGLYTKFGIDPEARCSSAPLQTKSSRKLGTLISRPTTSLFVNCIYAVEPPCTGWYARWCERPAGLCAPPTRLSCAALLTYAALHPRCVVPYFLLVFRFSAFRAGFPASTFIFLIFLLHHKILNLDTPAASLLQAPEGFEKRAARRQALAALLRFSKK